MKKLILLVAVTVVMLTACSNKTGGNTSGSDSLTSDSIQTAAVIDTLKTAGDEVQPGGVMAAPEEDWTEEAVAKAIQRYYDAVNKTFAEGSALSPFDLDKQYYTEYWNEVYNKVNEKDGRQPSVERCFFVDDAHWTNGLVTPLAAEDIKVELTTGDMAEASFNLKEKESGFSKNVFFYMEYEKGKWLIHNIQEKGDNLSNSMLIQMEKYIEKE